MAHPLIVEAAALGVRIEADDGALLVMPASRLTADLRARIVAAKPALLAELAPDDDTVEPDRDPARWLMFKALCVGRSVRSDELARHFPAVADREDIACSADDALEVFAEHMARVILAERADGIGMDAARAAAATTDPEAWRATVVTCGACLRFARARGRPHDGHCTVGAANSAVCWDTDRRTCERFEVAA